MLCGARSHQHTRLPMLSAKRHALISGNNMAAALQCAAQESPTSSSSQLASPMLRLPRQPHLLPTSNTTLAQSILVVSPTLARS
jgi:hypothetical protein